MIPGLNAFVKTFKDMADNHIGLYENEAFIFRKWSQNDFDVSKIVEELNTSDRKLLYTVIKKAYDIVRAYHRSFNIYSQTRGDYYRYAALDREKDKLVIDNVVNNLHKLYDDFKSQLLEES